MRACSYSESCNIVSTIDSLKFDGEFRSWQHLRVELVKSKLAFALNKIIVNPTSRKCEYAHYTRSSQIDMQSI